MVLIHCMTRKDHYSLWWTTSSCHLYMNQTWYHLTLMIVQCACSCGGYGCFLSVLHIWLLGPPVSLIRDKSSTSVLFLKSALSIFSEMLDMFCTKHAVIWVIWWRAVLKLNQKWISQQPYMLLQNCLYHSVQLKMVSLLIWIVWNLSALQKWQILMKHIANKGIFTILSIFS